MIIPMPCNFIEDPECQNSAIKGEQPEQFVAGCALNVDLLVPKI